MSVIFTEKSASNVCIPCVQHVVLTLVETLQRYGFPARLDDLL